MCDALRDINLWDVGVYLENNTNLNLLAIVRPLDAALVAARQESAAKAKVEAKAKREAEAAGKKRQLAKEFRRKRRVVRRPQRTRGGGLLRSGRSRESCMRSG